MRLALSFKLLLGSFLLLACLFCIPKPAAALSSSFPDNSNVSPNSVPLRSLVSETGGQVTLTADEADYTIFIPDTRSSDVTVTIEGACNFSEYNDLDNEDISTGVYEVNPASIPGNNLNNGPQIGNTKQNHGAGNDCSGGDITFNVNNGHFKKRTDLYGDDYRLITLKVFKDGSGGGLKAFQVQTNGQAFVTFQQLPAGLIDDNTIPSTHAFAVWNATTDTSGNPSATMQFRFAPDCSYTTGDPVFLKWYDGDNGASNQPDNISFQLLDLDAGSNPVSLNPAGSAGATNRISGSQIGGNGQNEYAKIVGGLNSKHKYLWVWSNVDRQNGLQLWMPFSDMSTSVTCPGWSLNDSSTITPQNTSAQGNSCPSGGTAGTSNISVSSQSTCVTFQHDVSNKASSATPADYDWRVEGCYISTTDPGYPTCSNYGPSHDGGSSATMPSDSETSVNPGGDSADLPVKFNYKFSYKSNPQAGDKYCQEITYNNANGPGTPPGSYSTHSNPVCVEYDPTPTVTMTCNASDVISGQAGGGGYTPPFAITSFQKDGAAVPVASVFPTGQTGSTGAFSTNVSSLMGGATHTFKITIKFSSSSSVSKSVPCYPAGGGGAGCPTFSGDTRTITLTAQNIPSNTATPGGYSSSPGTTGYTYTSNNKYQITNVTDGYETAANATGGTGWSPTTEATNNFTIYYDKWIKDYPYDSHQISVTYNSYYDRQQYRASNTATYYCPYGSLSGSSCSYPATANTTYSCPAGQFMFWGDCFRPNPDGSNTDTGHATATTTYSCPYYGAFNFGSPTCYYTATNAGYAWVPIGSPTTDIDNSAFGFGTTSASVNGTPLPECYDRSFNIDSANGSTTYYSPDNESPTSVSGGGATVNVSFNYPSDGPQPGDGVQGVHNTMNTKGFTYSVVYSVVRTGAALGCSGSSGTFNVTDANAHGPGSGSYNLSSAGTCAVSLPPLQVGDVVCADYTITPQGDRSDENGTITEDNDVSVYAHACTQPIVNEPYVNFLGGDVSAGGGFNTGMGTCSGSGGITTNNKSSIPARGSSVQLGALSIGPVSGFSSASLRSSAPTASVGLTFANEFTNGNLGGTHCVPNYYATMPSGTTPLSGAIDLGSLNGAYSATGPVTISGTVTHGNRVAIYVNGNVTITGNTKLGTNGSGWSGISDVPSLFVIAKGNIGVTSGVSSMDGVYVAQGASGSGGVINTCTDGSGTAFNPASLYVNCNSQLTVNGAFVAGQVLLDRAYSSLRHSVAGENLNYAPSSHPCDISGGAPSSPNVDCAAEIFNFSPETYIGAPAIGPNASNSNGKYDYITSLSPVL